MRIIRFSAKGWRERFDDGFDEENVSRIADAFGYIWAEAKPGSTILVGYDTRFDGRRLAGVVAGVLSSHGLNAVVSDAPCPTPALGWGVAQRGDATGAVMLTASSASCEYGGISARGADGGPVAEEFYEAAAQIISPGAVDERGAYATADLVSPYLEHLKTCVNADVIARAGLTVVVDPMYGSSRRHLAQLLRSLGCKVREIHGEDVPDFGGLHPLPSEPWVDKCEQAVLACRADLGISLDGDADRMSAIDGRGRLVTPHRLVPLIMEHLVADRGETGRVVATFSSSAYVRRQAGRLGCPFTAVPMGFSRIYREFVEGDVLMGADEFGGVAIPSHLCERDGMLSSLLLIEAVAASGLGLDRMVERLEKELGVMHYIRRDIRLDAASIQSFRNVLPGLYLPSVCGMQPVSVGHSDGLVLRFADDSWVQLRPSRTEPLVRACAEAPRVALADALADETCKGALSRLRRI